MLARVDADYLVLEAIAVRPDRTQASDSLREPGGRVNPDTLLAQVPLRDCAQSFTVRPLHSRWPGGRCPEVLALVASLQSTEA